MNLILAISLLLVSTAVGSGIGDLRSADWRKVVVISDLHGDDMGLFKSLWIGLKKVVTDDTEVPSFIDFVTYFANYNDAPETPPPIYKGTDVVLIQMGDLIDRGPNGRTCMKILGLVTLIIGWPVQILYGNHDLYASIGRGYADMIHPADDMDRALAFGSGGRARLFMLNHGLLAVRLSDSTLFVHGGMEPDWLQRFIGSAEYTSPIGFLNIKTQELVARPSRETMMWFMSASSPVMTRSLFEERMTCGELDEVLRFFQVQRILVGHTIQMGRRVTSRCHGQMIFTDVMISRWMTQRDHDPTDLTNSQPSAVIISTETDTIEAWYSDGISGESIFTEPILEAPAMTSVSQISSKRKDLDREHDDGPRKIYEDDLATISITEDGFVLTITNTEQMHRIEYIRTEMVDASDRPYPGLPNILLLSSNRNGMHKKTKSQSLAESPKQVLLTANVLSPELSALPIERRIVTVMQHFHNHDLCVGFIPRCGDSIKIKENAAAWIRSFFTSANDSTTLINLSRVSPCEDSEGESQYVSDAFDLDDDLSDDSSEDETTVGGVLVFGQHKGEQGAILSVPNAPAIHELMQRHAAVGVRLLSSTVLLIPTSDIQLLSERDWDSNLAHQTIHILGEYHAHNLCVLDLETDDEMEDHLKSILSIDDSAQVATLVDLSYLRDCPDESDHEYEDLMAMKALLPFISEEDEESDQDEEI